MYYKQIVDGFITAIGISDSVGENETEIEYNEYTEIMDILKTRPTYETGFIWKLSIDKVWVKVEEEISEEEANIEDYENSLKDMGVQFGD